MAVMVAVLVAAPWYFLLWARLGNPCLYTLFIFNSLGRALDPSQWHLLYCFDTIWRSSGAFKLVGLALMSALGCWVVKHQRTQWSILVFFTAGYLLALTAGGKGGNYVFYVFPLVAVLLASLFLESGPRLITRLRPNFARTSMLLCVGLAVGLVGYDCVITLRILVSPAWIHPSGGHLRAVGHGGGSAASPIGSVRLPLAR